MSMSPGSSVRSPGSITATAAAGVARRHLDDPLVLDQELARLHQLALVHVEHPGASQVDGGCGVRGRAMPGSFRGC